ncbi:MAG: hypothetical protein DMG43_10470 [Acidobacteria bacterium]|nr:MAG: hypothetical protein DMG43_10470 [Acidobacteriota bacterium]
MPELLHGFTMKHLVGLLMTTVFLVLLALSGRYISNAESFAGLCWAIILLLLAQSCLWAGGEFARGGGGKLGIWRGLAILVFVMQTMTIPLILIQIIWSRMAHVRGDEAGVLTHFQLAWGFSGGLVAAFLLLMARKRWRRRVAQL